MEGTDETVRVVSMDRDFHVDCYMCCVCGMQLTDEPDKRCYPLAGKLLLNIQNITFFSVNIGRLTLGDITSTSVFQFQE